MKKLKNIFNRIAKRFYLHMMTVCAEQSELACVEHGEESDENLQWVELYEEYLAKYEKLTGKSF